MAIYLRFGACVPKRTLFRHSKITIFARACRFVSSSQRVSASGKRWAHRQDRIHADRIQSATATGGARSALVASWRRSAELRGLDPTGTRISAHHCLKTNSGSLSSGWTGWSISRRRAWIAFIWRSAAWAAACCLPIITACRWNAGEAAGDDETFYRWGLWTGAVWSEESEGTNGIGTCIVEQRA